MRTSSLLLLAIVVGVLYAISTPAAAFYKPGRPITEISSPHVQELGAWAVVKHGEVSNDGLRFNKVVSGWVHFVTGGKVYRLDIQAVQIGGKDAMYKAVVLEKEDSPYTTFRRLISFGRPI